MTYKKARKRDVGLAEKALREQYGLAGPDATLFNQNAEPGEKPAA